MDSRHSQPLSSLIFLVRSYPKNIWISVRALRQVLNFILDNFNFDSHLKIIWCLLLVATQSTPEDIVRDGDY